LLLKLIYCFFNVKFVLTQFFQNLIILLIIHTSLFFVKKIMLSKTNVIKAITKFPDNFSIDDLVNKMILLDKIEKGL